MTLKFGKWSRVEIITLLGTIVLFFASRLYHLQARFWPMFTDEAIYVHWAQIGKYQPEMRLASLSDGKPPLFIWLTTILMQWIGNPLTAGRLVSVIAGAATLVGIYFLTKELFKNKGTAILAMLIYTVFPFALFQNRWAILESLAGAFFIWGLYFTSILARYLRTESAFMLGLIFGGGLLTKTTGFMGIFLLPVSLLLHEKPKNKRLVYLSRWVLLSLLSLALALTYYAVIQLSPDADFVNTKNNIFIYNTGEILKLAPVATLGKNLMNFIDWLAAYITWPWIILSAAALFLKDKRKEIFFLWLCFALPLMVLVILGKLIYPRYLYFLSLPLVPLISYAFLSLRQKLQNMLVLLLVTLLGFIFAVFSDYRILTDLARAPLPEIDLFQYVNGWPAGGGVFEIINFLQKESQKEQIYVFAEGLYGSLPTTALNIYFRDNANVHHAGVNLAGAIDPLVFKVFQEGYPTYLITNQTQEILPAPFQLIAEYRKGVGNWFIRLYRLKS